MASLDQRYPWLSTGAVNRRKFPRFDVELRCAFAGDLYAGKGTVLDLSMEGCSVRSDTPLVKGQYVEVFINLLGQISPLPVKLAVSRWSTGPLFGLEFIRIADEHHARLHHYVQDLEQARIAMVSAPLTGGGEAIGVAEG